MKCMNTKSHEGNHNVLNTRNGRGNNYWPSQWASDSSCDVTTSALYSSIKPAILFFIDIFLIAVSCSGYI